MNISITTTAKTDDEAQGAARRVPVPVQELRVSPWPSLPSSNRETKREKLVDKVRDEARAS